MQVETIDQGRLNVGLICTSKATGIWVTNAIQSVCFLGTDAHGSLSAKWKSLGHVLGEKRLRCSPLGNREPLWAFRQGSEEMIRIF